MRGSEIIPLLPLDTVVFPGHLLPLHIFEGRHRRLIADCTAAGASQPFGIHFERRGEMAGAGCAVVVTGRGQAGHDGSFDVVCRGERRYRLVEVVDEAPYLRARVEFFDDDDDEADPALKALVARRFGSLAALAAQEAGTRIVDGGQVQEEALPDGPALDAWTVAQHLGLESTQRQVLLEMRSENARLQDLAQYLESLLPILEARQARHRRVKSNGHSGS